MDYNKIVLFSDLDGTLFDSSTAVPEINRQAIQHFTEQGGIFCVSTGRTQHNAAPYLEKVAVNGPCILYNGAAAYSFASRRFLFARTVLEEALEEYIRQILQDYPAVNVQVYTPEEICFVSPQELADAEFVRLHQPCIFSSLERAPRPWLKLLLQGTPDQLRAVQQMAPASVRESCDMVFSSPIYLELLPKGANKGSALHQLRSLPQLEGRTFVAIGDYNNDLELLQNADIAAAPQNALPAVQALADHLVCSNDEGAVADLINRVIPSL